MTMEELQKVLAVVKRDVMATKCPHAKTYVLAIPEAIRRFPDRPLEAIESQLLYVQNNLTGRGPEVKAAKESVRMALTHLKKMPSP